MPNILSRNMYRQFIIYPINLAIGPIILPEYWVKIICVNVKNLLYYGTGSYPPFEKGLHLNILHPANIEPFTAPYFSIACNP